MATPQSDKINEAEVVGDNEGPQEPATPATDTDTNAEAEPIDKPVGIAIAFPRETKRLPTRLTEDEVRRAGKALASTQIKRYNLKEEAAEVNKNYRQDLEKLDDEIDELARKVHTGIEERQIVCFWRANHDKKEMELARGDTGEVLQARKMTESELQRVLPLGPDEAEAG